MQTEFCGRKNLNVQVDFRPWKRVQQAAVDDGLKITDIVRQALKDWLARKDNSEESPE